MRSSLIDFWLDERLTPDPLPGRLTSVEAAFLFVSFTPRAARVVFDLLSFCTPPACVVDLEVRLALLVAFLPSFASTTSVFVTLLTSPRAGRRFCAAVVVAVVAFALLLWRGFLTAPPLRSVEVRAAALALVRRVEVAFSSFSLVTVL